MKESTTCENKRQKEKKGAVKQHTERLKKGERKEEKNKKELKSQVVNAKKCKKIYFDVL